MTPEQREFLERIRQNGELEAQTAPEQGIPPRSVDAMSVKEAQADIADRYTATEALGNIPESGMRLLGDIAKMALSPMETLSAMRSMFSAEGMSALGDFYKQRYGSVENAMRTAYTDPAGFMADVSGVGAGIALLSKIPRVAAKVPGKQSAALTAAASGMERAGQALAATDPLYLSVKAPLVAGSAIGQAAGLPQSIYETALKMGTSPRTKMGQRSTREGVIETLLEQQIPITEGGLKILQSNVNEAMKIFDGLISQATQSGVMIPVSQALQGVQKLRRSLNDPTSNPNRVQQVQAIDDYVQTWLNDLGPVRELTPNQVLQLRRNMDSLINYQTVGGTTPPLQSQITEAMAEGSRESLRQTVEGLGQTGTNLNRMLTAEEALSRAVNRLSQNQQFSLPQIGMFGVGVGAAPYNEIVSYLAMAGALLANPGVKQAVARAIYNNTSLSADQRRSLLSMIGTQGLMQTPQVVEATQQEQQQ